MAGNRGAAVPRVATPVIVFLVVIALVFAAFSLLHGQFLSARNLTNLLRHASIFSIFALGVLFVVVVGHFDLSFYLVCGLAGMTTSWLIAVEVPAPWSVGVGLVVGALFGIANGVAIGRWKLPDMVTTIGTGAVAWGFAWIYSKGSYIWQNARTSGILLLNDGTILRLPVPVVFMLGTYLLALLAVHRSRFGRGFYATGENRVAAVFSGVHVEAFIVAAFTICAVLTSMGAILSNASQGAGSVRVGMVFLLPAYATVFLGSAVFRKATVHGTLVASLFISLMLNGFTLMAVPYYYSDLIVGIVLIVALALSSDTLSRLRESLRRAGRRREEGRETEPVAGPLAGTGGQP
ncbi:MAG TPA: ABC transporter permease [Anaeromyxobacter sp.]|nr:ABC transporter permease [Anaeromyxobacter sp.]